MEQREGHAQQQRVEITTLGEECGKDAVERGHNERRVEGYGLVLRGRGIPSRVQQLEFRRVIADGLRELGVLLFGQRLEFVSAGRSGSGCPAPARDAAA